MHLTLFTDPGCPWAYSATPDLTTLRWRYGNGLEWRIVVIGLAENGTRYDEIGFHPARMAAGNISFSERFGMPFQLAPRVRNLGTGRACRVIVAAGRLGGVALQWRVLRALQLAWFTTDALLDEDAALTAALGGDPAIDAAAVMAAVAEPATEEIYQEHRAMARSAEGGPTDFQGKTANTDGAVRFTAPSVIFRTAEGDSLEAGGFQSLAVYDAMVANLDRSLQRRPPAATATEALAAFDHGLTTQEIAAIKADGLAEPDRAGATAELIELVAAGKVTRRAHGDDAIWQLA